MFSPESDQFTAASTPVNTPGVGDDDDDEEEQRCHNGSACKRKYESVDRPKWMLFSMCVGMFGIDGRRLGDTDVAPYRDMKFRKTCIPTSIQYREEVSRRCQATGKEPPQCRYWNKEKLLLWLKDNPVNNLDDREWLLEEEKKVFDLLTRAAKAKSAVTSAPSWTDNRPWMRLYCCLYDEKARPHFLAKDNVMNRTELDARNNENRPLTLWEKVAELMNDSDNIYQLPSLPQLHSVFASSTVLGTDCFPGPITPEDARKRIADSRARLMKVISNWELSGNGFGQRAPDHQNFGIIEEDQLLEGDNRSSFVDTGKEHLLVLWDLGQAEGVLDKFLNKLSTEVSISPDNIHTDTSEVQIRRKMNDEQKATQAFRDSVAESMQSMSYTALLQELRQTELNLLDLKEKEFKSHNDDAIEFYRNTAKFSQDRMSLIKEEMERIKKSRTE